MRGAYFLKKPEVDYDSSCKTDSGKSTLGARDWVIKGETEVQDLSRKLDALVLSEVKMEGPFGYGACAVYLPASWCDFEDADPVSCSDSDAG